MIPELQQDMAAAYKLSLQFETRCSSKPTIVIRIELLCIISLSCMGFNRFYKLKDPYSAKHREFFYKVLAALDVADLLSGLENGVALWM